jgi:hypothetical protein
MIAPFFCRFVRCGGDYDARVFRAQGSGIHG